MKSNNVNVILTTLITGIINIIIILAIALISKDFVLSTPINAIIIVLLLSIVNTLLWLIFTRILMRFFIITFGIGALILNGLMFYAVAHYLPGLKITLIGALITTLSINIATTLIYNLANIDFYNHFIQKLSKKEKNTKNKYYPGLIMLEIDGLDKEILEEAINKGYMSTLERWINTTHFLKEWETDLSSQTGASQAGILHGNNIDIVAYRWVEK